MTSRDFIYWFQGFLEVGSPIEINSEQLKIIRAHLNMVFKHEIDPSFGDSKHQEHLNKLHHTKPLTPFTDSTLVKC